MVGQKGTILVLDDQIRYGVGLVDKLLDRYGPKGYDVVLVGSPKEGLDRLKRGDIVAIVADFFMRDAPRTGLKDINQNGESIDLSNGYKFIVEANRRRPETEIMLHTGQAGIQTAIDMTGSSIGKFVPKTDDNHILFETLDEKLTRYDRLVRHTVGSGRGDNVFLTGGSGFVGDLKIKKYLEIPNMHIWALSRPTKEMTAEERILHRIDHSLHSRITVVKGDLGMRFNEKGEDISAYMGLDIKEDEENYAKFMEMLKVVNEIDHTGAYLSFAHSAIERQKLMDINLMGTQRLLNIVGLLQRPVEGIYYTSTAFVNGLQSEPQVFFEDEARPNRWINPYEESKYRSELLIKGSGHSHSIIRIPIVAKEMGAKVLSDDTIYGVKNVIDLAYAKFQSKFPDQVPHVRIEGSEDASNNIMLRSELVDLMFAIRNSDHGMNHTYNAVNPHTTPNREVFAAMFGSLDPKITFDFVSSLQDGGKSNTIEALFNKMVSPLYQGYLFKNAACYNNDNVVAAVGKDNLSKITPMTQATLLELFKDHYKLKKEMEK